MIKVVSERLCDQPVRIQSVVPLSKLKNALEHEAMNRGLPMEVEEDQLVVGRGLGSMLVKPHSCVVCKHPQHKGDYYGWALLMDLQGSAAFLTMYMTGDSKNYHNKMLNQSTRSSILTSILTSGAAAKYQQETMYYDAVKELIEDVVFSDTLYLS